MTSAALSAPLVVVTAAALSWAVLHALLPLLHRRLLDRPNARSAHHQPTPRGGGLAFGVVGTLWGLPLIPLVCAPLALVGLLDDWLDLPVGWRYGIQLITAVALVALAVLPLPAGVSGWLLAMVLVVAITAVINFVNFMDGLDGLVGGCLAVFFSVAAMSLKAAWLLPLVGALLGFLAWNWNPARVFMGDVGSTFLGAVMAGVVLQEPEWKDALGLLLVGSPLLGDALICVLRRWRARQPLTEAHRLHLYQRLQGAGVSSQGIATAYAIAVAALGVGLMLGGLTVVIILAVLILGIGIYLDQVKALPFA